MGVKEGERKSGYNIKISFLWAAPSQAHSSAPTQSSVASSMGSEYGRNV